MKPSYAQLNPVLLVKQCGGGLGLTWKEINWQILTLLAKI